MTIAGLAGIEDVADALLAQVPADQDPLLAELIQARADFANAGTMQLPVSTVQELGDIARSAAAELPSWIPAPQIPAPVPASDDFAMAALDPRIVIVIVIVILIIVILIILILLGLWVYERLKETWESVKRLKEQGT